MVGDRAKSQGALYGASVEYGLHCLLWLMEPRDQPISSRDLAELQGVSPSLLAKILPRLEKAGLVISVGGIKGGYRLARPGSEISVLQVIDSIDGRRSVLDCKEVRRGCALFGSDPPGWATRKVCSIHAVMLRAEKAMRDELSSTSLADIYARIPSPAEFGGQVAQWLDDRATGREQSRVEGLRRRKTEMRE